MSDSLMTPADVYAACEAAWGRPALDPCWHPASPVRPHLAYVLGENLNAAEWAVDVRFHEMNTIVGDGLAQDWRLAPPGWIWLNPPYSDPRPWLQKLVDSGRPAAALLKDDHTTSWYRDFVRGRTRGLFDARLEYKRTDGGKQAKANFPSVIVLYGTDHPPFKLPKLNVEWWLGPTYAGYRGAS